MFGFAIGTLCLVALIAIAARRRRWMWAHAGGGCGSGCGPDHGHHGHGFGPRFFLRGLFSRLETTPGQEKVIGTAAEGVVAAARKAKDEIDESRKDVARTISGAAFDEGALGSAFARWDEAVSGVRKAIADALASTHEALDERQRARLAELLAKGHGDWSRWDHPYRGF